MNILFTCAGRRNYLLDFFKSIKGVKVFACDISVYAPALHTAHESFIVPDVYNNEYITILLSESKKRDINAIIPLNDLELPILAKSKCLFDKIGIKVIVSDLDVINICFDKIRTVDFSESISVTKIPTFTDINEAFAFKKENNDCSFIIKPRWGTASIGIASAQDLIQLEYQYNLIKSNLTNTLLNKISSSDSGRSVIIQKMISGIEYGIDVINDLNGSYVTTLIRKKLAMRAGETDKAVTVHDNRINKIGEEIGQRLKHIGLLDCDIFVEDNNIFLLEMNPRIGGGYPFSHIAGANYPVALINWLKGHTAPSGCFDYKSDFFSAKADNIIAVNPQKLTRSKKK